MPDKKYLIEIPGMPEGTGIWEADKWERNKDAFMAENPDAHVYELGEYDPEDSDEHDQIMLTFEGDAESSGVWDLAKWERNKDAFTAENPGVRVQRVRYHDYWGERATANREQRAQLLLPDADRNARLAELGYYDDLSEGQLEFGMDTNLGFGLKPLSSAIETSVVTGQTKYLDPAVQEFFANDSAYTDRMAEIARLDAEYESNPAVIAQREWEAQQRAEQAKYIDSQLAAINAEVEKIDAHRASVGAMGNSMDDFAMASLAFGAKGSVDAALEDDRLQTYRSAAKLYEKARQANEVAGKGFWAAAGDVGKDKLRDLVTQSDIQMYNQIGDILTRLESQYGSLSDLTDEQIENGLSKEEQALIRGFFAYNEAMEAAGQDMSRAYKGGKIFGESISFMLEFLATGGLARGTGKAAGNVVSKGLLRWARKAAAGTAKRTARAFTARAARGLTSALVGTAARTIAAPGTYGRMAEESVKIEDGHLHRGMNAFVGFVDAYIENLSEISGGVIGKTLKMAGINPAKMLGKIPFGKIGQLLADNRLAQGIAKLGKNIFGEKGLLKKFGFNGIFEEVEEEYIGNLIREYTIQDGALAEMHKDGNFGSMLIGFAPMTLFGAGMSAVQMGAANIEAANLGKKLRETLGYHYSEEQINHMMNLVEKAENGDQVAQAINTLEGLNQEEAQQLLQYGAFMAQNKAMLFARKAQDDSLAQAKRAEYQQQFGNFWQTSEDGAESVQVAELRDGRTVFVTSAPNESGMITIIDAETGRQGFSNVSEYAEQQDKEGNISQKTRTWAMDAFLESRIASERLTAQEARMSREYNEQVQNLQSQITSGTKINLGTTGNPIWMVATGQTSKDGVFAVDSTGATHTIGWMQVADAMKQPIRVKTDQEIIDEEVAAVVARNAERRKKMRNATPAMTDAVNESAAQTAEAVAQESKHIPMNEDGTVNEAAFWEQDPEGYVQWNDEQNQDGGADSLQQVAITKAVLTSLLAEAQQAQQTSNPAERKAAKLRAQEIAEKIDRLTAIEASYAEQRIAPLRERALRWKSLTNAPVYIVETEEELASISGQAAESNKGGARVRGFAKDGRAYIYLPGIVEESEIDAVFMHEAVAHTGLKGMLGQQAFDQLCDQVWEMMSPEARQVFIDYPGVNGDKRAAADEYIAHIAERMGSGVATAEEKTIWQKIVDFVRNVLRAMGVDINLSESELADLLQMAYKDLAENMAEAEKIVAQQQKARVAAQNAPSTARQEYDTYAEDLTHDEIKAVAENEFNAAQEAYNALAASAPKVEMGESAKDFIARKKAYNEQLAEAKAALGARQALIDEIARIDAANAPVLTDAEVLEQEGLGVDTQNDDVRMSVRYVPTEKQREMIIGSIMNVTGRTREEAERWLASETSLAAMITDNLQYLDYVADPKYKAIKDNSDYPQGTVDFNNICRKRLPFTRMFTRLQRRFPNRVFTAEELADIRTIMSQDDLMVACGLCYVEDRRQMVGEVAQSFIYGLQEQFKTYANNPTKKKNAKKFNELIAGDAYVPQVYDLTTQEGLDKLYNEHRGIWEAFQAFNNARGQQSQNLLQGYAEYKREILSWNDKKVKSVNDNGGLRIFSYSDFEAHHLIDVVQIIIDCAAKGVKIQGYTKVPEFARAVANTGIKLNRSLIPLGDTGLVDGQLAFDPVEGIDINDPNFLESNDNVGNILIGINDEQIRIAMADPRIHYIIPYHARQKENIRQKLNVGAWTNYISTQNERNISDGKRVKDNINIYTDILTGDVTTDRQFVEKYLQLCKEKGRIPKFDQFLKRDAEGNYLYTPGYYKFLVDFKLFDENGNILPQQPVVAEFDDAFNMQILENYAKDERESTGDQMNETYDKIVNALGLDESTAVGEDVRFSTVKEIADKFNAELQQQIEGTLPAGHVYQLGMPSRILRSTGIANVPIQLNARRLEQKSKDFGHDYDLEEIKNLVLALQRPIAVFAYGDKAKAQNIVVEIQHEGKNFIVGMSIRPAVRGNVLEVNSVRNVFPKDNAEWLNWIAQRKSLYLDKQKIQALIDQQRTNLADVEYLDLDSIAKIVNDFVNPNLMITSEQDKAYMDAVEVGDMETAQRMVLEAARLAMPNTKVVDNNGAPKVVYHGSPNVFYKFGSDPSVKRVNTAEDTHFFVDDMEVAQSYGKELYPVFLNITNPIVKDFEGNSWNQYARPITPEELNEWEEERKARKERIKDLQEKIEMLKTDYEASIDENDIFGDPVILQEINELEGELNMATMLDRTLSTPPTHTYSTTDKLVAGSRDTSDGAIFNNVTDAASPELTHKVVTDYVAYSPKQIKSAEPVTYDDAGNVIPLSERFNPENEDIRFSARTDEQRAKLFADAKAKFGLTDNFNVAGYMLPDGSLLNFGDPANPTTRAEDHRAIEGVIMENGTEYDSRWMYLADFMNEGAIRLLPEYAGINLMKAPTKEQRSRLFDFIYKYNGEVILEIADERLNNVAYVEYDRRTSPSRIFRDIDGYFNEGIVPEDIRFSFIGERGAMNDKTEEGLTRLANLDVARQMESELNPDWSAKENEAALKIKVATGWERGADGLWRYEVLDGNIKDNPALERMEWYADGEMRYEYVGKLPDLYDNPELYRMYPFLKDTTVEINPYRMGSEDGSYNKAINLIKLVSSYRNWVINHSDRYHEINKNLDNTIEDMSDEEAAAYLDEWETSDEGKELQELMKKEVGHYEVGFTKWEKEGYAREILLHEIQHAIQGYEGFAGGTSGWNPNYNVYGGEVESRNASRRMRMSPEERRNALLASTEDVARKDQIFIMDSIEEAENSLRFSVFEPHNATIDEIDGLFREYNMDESLVPLYDKVSALAHTMDLKIRFDYPWSAAAGSTFGDKVKFNTEFFNSLAYKSQDKAHALLHEMIHATTNYAIAARNTGALTEGMKEAVSQLESIYGEIVNDRSFDGTYGAKSIYEMVAELSNPDFRNLLKEKNLFQRIVDAIKRLLGIEVGENALDNLSATLDYMLDNYDGRVFGAVVDQYQKHQEYARFSAVQIDSAVRQEMDTIKAKAMWDGTFMKAPNGAETKLTEDQWLLVRTNNFKNWFGDWENDPENASKVVDENGEPMVVYHGVNLTFKNKGIPFWTFYEDQHFGTERQAKKIQSFGIPGDIRKMYNVFLNIRNIKRVSDVPEDWIRAHSEYWEPVFAQAKSEGHDGLVYINEWEDSYSKSDSYVAFNPNQIKSATETTGEFSESDDIRYSSRFDVNTSPTEAQKKAGNYKMGHLRLDGYNITIENPKGSVRRGTDSKGNEWENTLNNDYGYIRGTEGVDGDHIDVYLSDNPAEGNVFVIDQVNPETREFDEHKVMYGFNSMNEAREAYLANFSEGWNGLGTITEVTKDEFRKWIDSSHRKTKPFSEYKSVKTDSAQSEGHEEVEPRFSVRTKPAPQNTGIGYKVFYLKDGKLYPPMVANIGGVDTPVMVWLDADAAPIAGKSKTGRTQVKAGGKGTQGGGGTLAYRPGWHLGEIPYALQFNRKDENGDKTLFPANFVWAEVEYADDVNYQEEAMSYGINANGKFQHSLAGLPKVPTDGSYRYRTNPNPETDPWIITGAMKVNRLLTPSEVDQMVVAAGREPQKRQEGAVTDEQINALNESLGLSVPADDTRFSAISTPTDNVVAEGMKFSIQDFARLAGNIFQDMPESFRKEAIEETFKRGWDMQSAIFQIPARLAEKESWDEADKDLAKVIREKVQDAMDESGVVMSRPLTTKEALWMLYRSTEANSDSMMDAAKRSIVAHNLGFDSRSMALKEKADDYIRYSVVRNGQIDAATDMYNYEANLWTNRLKESWFDMNQSVIALQNALEDASGKPIASWENVVLALNQLASKSYAEKKKYLRDFLMPLWDQIIEMTKVSGLSIEQIERYMMLKHGLERNKKFAMRDAKQFYREMYDKVADRMKNTSHAEQVVALSEANKRIADIDAQIAAASGKKLKDLQEARERAVVEKEIAELVLRNDEQQNEADLQMYFNAIEAENNPKYAEFREKDYGGLTSMFMDQIADVKRSDYKTDEAYQAALLASVKPRFDKVADMEAEAQEEVDDYESKAYMPALWKLVNAATKETLRHQHAAGVITTEQYDVVRNMFDYYVPLRGFADNTAEDMYSYYMNNSAGGFAKPIIAAKGRKTRAESPLGWIGTMAESAIQQDNKNEVKMKLYYALMNRPDTGVLSLSEMWYVYDHTDPNTGKKVFVPAYPPATGGVLTADQMRQHIDAWEQSMKAKQAIGEAYKREQGVNLGGSVIFQDKAQDAEHIIRVKVAGKDYAILVNGNPRAAQAVNGLLNPDANVGPVRQWYGALRRGLSALMTSFSPLFWVSNYQRDLLSSFMRTSLNEGWGQAFKYLGNRFHGWKAAKYIYTYDNGTIGNSYYENLYKEFAENGGITGYTSLTTNKEYEKLLADYAKNVDKEMLNWIKRAWDKFMRLGEAVEQVSRFAAYITARESGKSIEEAVAAAKEVSVNFNRKGSTKPISLDELEKLRDKNGKPLSMPKKAMAIAFSAMPSALKELYFFFNASIQALSSSAKLAKKSPGKAMTWAGMYMGLSVGLAFLNYLLAGDDDDNDYLDLPDYLRHSTALFKMGDNYYFKWSLPQEMRPFYATADILVSKIMGKTPHKTAWDTVGDIALAAAEWLPVNPFGTEDPILALVPDVAAPLAEIKANQNSFGGRIYNDMPFVSEDVAKQIPAYRKGTSKTGEIYVDMAEFLNDITGGDEVQKGIINLNPAMVEHLVEGYGGGIYDFGKLIVGIPGLIYDAIWGEGVEVREIPFVNKVLLSTDETNMYSHVNEAFYHYQGIADNAKRVENEYRKSDDPSRADDYRNEEDWRIYLLFRQYEKDLETAKEKVDNAADETEREVALQEQNAIREMLLQDIARGTQPDASYEIAVDLARIKAEANKKTKAGRDARAAANKAGRDPNVSPEEYFRLRDYADSLQSTAEYERNAELAKAARELEKQIEQLRSTPEGPERDSLMEEIQRQYNLLLD